MLKRLCWRIQELSTLPRTVITPPSQLPLRQPQPITSKSLVEVTTPRITTLTTNNRRTLTTARFMSTLPRRIIPGKDYVCLSYLISLVVRFRLTFTTWTNINLWDCPTSCGAEIILQVVSFIYEPYSYKITSNCTHSSNKYT